MKKSSPETWNRRDCLKAGAAALAGAVIPGGAEAAEGLDPLADVFEVFHKRRSVRKYKSDPVPEEHVKKILEAANMAPCTMNMQAWKFIVVRDKDKIAQFKTETVKFYKEKMAQDPNLKDPEKLKQTLENASSSVDKYLTAPVYVVVLVDMEAPYPDYRTMDGTLAAANLMLAARALGYGTVFITDAVPSEATKRALQIPDRYNRICLLPIGVPDAWPETPKKKKLEEVVCYETL